MYIITNELTFANHKTNQTFHTLHEYPILFNLIGVIAILILLLFADMMQVEVVLWD